MLGKHCRDLGDYAFGDFSLRLARFGIQTWMMNLCGLIFALSSFYLTVKYHIFIALILFFISYIFYYMDGSISNARRFYGKHSIRYHKLFHTLSDILSETIFYFGLGLSGYAFWRHSILTITSYIVLIILEVFVYNKRFFDIDEPYFDRSDRFIVIVIFFLLKKVYLCPIIITLINIISIIQRLIAIIKTKQPKLI